jgi:hypothetical protein
LFNMPKAPHQNGICITNLLANVNLHMLVQRKKGSHVCLQYNA